MPIRFQVDADFYDHPKALGLSDAATALWVRAGSYSAAKTTDGFIAEHVLPTLTQTPIEAAEELRRRGLWHKVRGGYRFHQWEVRNLTRTRIEADRQADRERKKRDRSAKNGEPTTNEQRSSVQEQHGERPANGEVPDTTPAGNNGTPQVNPNLVHPESKRSPTGIQTESERIPGASVSVSLSVSESESESGSGRGTSQPNTSPTTTDTEPPIRCPKHENQSDPPPCRTCGDLRKAHQNWVASLTRAVAEARSALARQHADTTRAAIAACQLCDHRGYVGAALCTHDPGQADRATAGAAAARAQIRPGPPRDSREPHDPDDALKALDAAIAELQPTKEQPA